MSASTSPDPFHLQGSTEKLEVQSTDPDACPIWGSILRSILRLIRCSILRSIRRSIRCSILCLIRCSIGSIVIQAGQRPDFPRGAGSPQGGAGAGV